MPTQSSSPTDRVERSAQDAAHQDQDVAGRCGLELPLDAVA
jgi:hypothetical protein